MTGRQHQRICMRTSITLQGKELVPRSSFCGLHPSCGTTACSRALGSCNFSLQTVLFCMVSFKLWHQGSLVASSLIPCCHLNISISTGWLPVNSGFMACFCVQSRGNLSTCPAHCSLLNFKVKTCIFSIKLFIVSDSPHPILSHWSKYLPWRFSFWKSSESLLFFWRLFRCHSHTWGLCQSRYCVILF